MSDKTFPADYEGGTIETWVPIDGYEGLYEVSNFGGVRSFSRKSYRGKSLVQQRGKHGYYTVALYKSGKVKRLLVHRLVARAFVPNPNKLPQVNHKDEDKSNNHVCNLEWCTAGYNLAYGTAPERRAKNRRKPCIGTWPDGTEVWFESTCEAERKTGICHAHICQVCNGKWYSAGKVAWRYAGASERDIRKDSTGDLLRLREIYGAGRTPSQQQRIYDYMREHGGITTVDAMCDLGVTRLSSRIFDLRKSGVEVDNERVTVKNRYGEDCSVVRYSLRG